VGFPIELSGLIDKVDDPSFSVAIGMILWGMENDATGFSGEIDNNKNGFGKRIFNSVLAKETVGDIKKWFKKFF
jgi:cell division ATPase FtsA